MTDVISLIVEGPGDAAAAPLLVRNLLLHFNASGYVVKVQNAHGHNNITKPKGLEDFLRRQRSNPDCKGAIVLLDAEEEHCDCPLELALSLAQRAKDLRLAFSVVIICPQCEYESWFLTSIHKMGKWLLPGTTFEGDPETMQNVKQWITNHRKKGDPYRETEHQASMTSAIDLDHNIAHSRSFRRMAHAVEELLEAIQTGTPVVTPTRE